MATVAQGEEGPDSGYVGRIPIRNLWLLMFYASDLFRAQGTEGVSKEKAPDDLPALIAEILAHAVERRQRGNLSLGYQARKRTLGRIRGRVDLLETERRQLLLRGLVACRFDELTVDTRRNRFVRGALEALSRWVSKKKDLAHRCRRLAHDMERMGVSRKVPTLHEMSVERYGWHDAEDRHMVEAAKLAFRIAIPTESPGSRFLSVPDRDEAWVRNLFERAVGGFYEVVLSPKGWQVRTGKPQDWQKEGPTLRIGEILPSMRTDIVLDRKDTGRRIVIDTKFTSIIKEGQYGRTLKSSYIYQLYAYLRSQVGREDDPLAKQAEGLLLHPSVGERVDEWVYIQGHRMRFATVDLTAETSEIRKELLRVVKSDSRPPSMAGRIGPALTSAAAARGSGRGA